VDLTSADAAGGAAGGGNKPVEASQVNVTFEPAFPFGEYTGTVESTARCMRYRLVTILETGGGQNPGSRGVEGEQPPIRVGEDRTNRQGVFRVKPSFAPDFSANYFARVKQERRRTVVCARDVSPQQSYPQSTTTSTSD